MRARGKWVTIDGTTSDGVQYTAELHFESFDSCDEALITVESTESPGWKKLDADEADDFIDAQGLMKRAEELVYED